MADADDPGAPGDPPPRDREAYLAEQIERQKRGEPIDVAWVREELDRIRRAQAEKMAATQRRLRLLVIGTAVLLLILWMKNRSDGGPSQFLMLGLVVIGALAVWVLGRNKKR